RAEKRTRARANLPGLRPARQAEGFDPAELGGRATDAGCEPGARRLPASKRGLLAIIFDAQRPLPRISRGSGSRRESSTGRAAESNSGVTSRWARESIY